jgi:hypothetical protein
LFSDRLIRSTPPSNIKSKAKIDTSGRALTHLGVPPETAPDIRLADVEENVLAHAAVGAAK